MKTAESRRGDEGRNRQQAEPGGRVHSQKRVERLVHMGFRGFTDVS